MLLRKLECIYASDNLVVDMYGNVALESTGRTVSVRLYNSTRDRACRTCSATLSHATPWHQQQWLAVIEELRAEASLPIPNSFDRSKEATEFS